MTKSEPAMPAESGEVSIEPLFQRYRLKGCELKNRVVMAPMTRGFAREGVPSEGTIAYYRRRAEGGTGLIITEGVAISPVSRHTDKGIPDFYGEAALNVWREVASAVHAAGGAFMPQLWHTGLLRSISLDREAEPSVGPCSKYPINGDSDSGAVIGRAMTEADIEATVEAFANAALAAERIGCDGIQLHGAHGYLIDEFFWEKTNRRKDRYAGGIAERTRFCVEIMRAIRARVSANFPVGLRFSQWKLSDHYRAKLVSSPQELETFLAPLVDAGVDVFDCSTRRYWESEFEGSDLNLAGWTKKLTGLPTMTVGSIGLDGPLMANRERRGDEARPSNNLARLMEMFERGDFDFVGVGRALIANPAWADKVKEGSMSDLVPYSSRSLAVLD